MVKTQRKGVRDFSCECERVTSDEVELGGPAANGIDLGLGAGNPKAARPPSRSPSTL